MKYRVSVSVRKISFKSQDEGEVADVTGCRSEVEAVGLYRPNGYRVTLSSFAAVLIGIWAFFYVEAWR
jgi:hypothetical protein